MAMHGRSTHALGWGGLTRPVQQLLGAAGTAFQRHPLLIKTVSSGMGFAFGDVLFQLGTTARPRRRTAAAPAPPPLAAVDWRRAALMGAAGLAVAGPVGYAFIMWMEGNIMTAAPHSRLALGVKLTLDQVLGFALWHAALAGIHEPHRATCARLLRPGPRPAAAAAQSKAK